MSEFKTFMDSLSKHVNPFVKLAVALDLLAKALNALVIKIFQINMLYVIRNFLQYQTNILYAIRSDQIEHPVDHLKNIFYNI